MAFGDIRVAERADWLIERIAAVGSVVLCKVGETRAGEMAVHRFLSSRYVSTETIVATLAARTAGQSRGRRILAAATFARRHPNLHLVYISNFKCGPDSYIKSFLDAAASRPSLVLQFDGHSNDAGFITRCEAYLDSKGFLRCPSSTTVM